MTGRARRFATVVILATLGTVVAAFAPARMQAAIYACPGDDQIPLYTNDARTSGCYPVFPEEASAPTVHLAKTSGIKGADRGKEPGAAPPVNLQANEIVNPGVLEPISRKMADIRRGSRQAVSIYHVGDSHVRSEAFPRGIAADLSARFGPVGGDFCFIKDPEGHGSKSGLHPKMPSHDPRVQTTNAPPPKQPQLICDAMTAIPRGATAQETAPASPAPRIRYKAFGISGKTLAYFAADPLFLAELRQEKPDLLLVTLGTNDAFGSLTAPQIAARIDHFLAAVRSAAPQTAVLMTGPPDAAYRDGKVNPYIAVVSEVMRSSAPRLGYAFWDLQRVMGGSGSINSWYGSGAVRPDKVHFTARGYRYQADLFTRAFCKVVDSYLQGGWK